jgi:hypothetical protein
MWRSGLDGDKWDANAYRGCSVLHPCIDYEFPFDCVREMSLPGQGSRVGTLGRNNAMFRMLFGMAGIDTETRMLNMSDTVKVFYCRICSVGNGNHYWKVEHSYLTISKPAFVTHSISCSCLSSGKSMNHSWTDIVKMKYESRYIAGCAIALFIGRKSNYFPKGIVEVVSTVDSNCDGVKLFYHKSSEGEEDQVLFVKTTRGSGGFHISNPLDANSKLQNKMCLKCKFKNSNQNGFRMMFGLDCKRHVLCENCVFEYFTSRINGVESISSKNKTNYCYGCNSSMRQVIHVSLGRLMEIRAPWAVGFMGKKPVFCHPFMAALNSFFQFYLAWTIDAVEECGIYLQDAREGITIERMKLHGVEDGEERKLIKKGIALLQIVRNNWELVSIWLSFRKTTYSFLTERNIPYPKEFLSQDASYYASMLPRRDFDVLRTRAICVQWNCEEHFGIGN